MAFGYEGYVTVKASGIEDVALCTGSSVPENRIRLDSGAAYGGQKTNSAPSTYDMALGAPHTYDFSQVDGNVDFEITQEFFLNQIIAWLMSRQTAGVIKLRSRKDNLQEYDHCYWNSIDLTGTSGAAVTGSIGFVAIQRDAYTVGGDYIGNKTGTDLFCPISPSPVMPPPLNPATDLNVNPVPFWNTRLNFDGTFHEFTDWNFSFSQDVVKFFVCQNESMPQPPAFMAVGPMAAAMNCTQMIVNTQSFMMPDTITLALLYIGTQAFGMGNLQRNQETDAVQGKSSMVPIVSDYTIYELQGAVP